MSCLPGNETPLLESEDARHKDWWIKIIDLTEAKHQILFALPMIFINVSYYFIPLVSVMFAGHLGDLELAGSNLANSWATVTGFSLVIGLSGALETLCGQGFGARMYRMMGINLQASCIITTIFSTLVSILWWYSDKILILLHQDPQISNSAGLYLKYLIPGQFAYGILQNILRFLQTQSVIVPLVVFSSIPLVLHIGIAYVLVYQTPSLGFKGAGLATSVSLWISVLMLGLYVVRSKRFHQTWQGFSSESFMYVSQNLKLALPSAAMVCLEYCAFEILVLLAGLMPDSEISTSLIAMCVNTEAICYMIAYGLCAAASTRVSNELGSGDPSRAKQATTVSLKLTVLLALFTVTLLSFGHNLWAKSFSDNPVIVEAYASMTPLLALSIFCDFVQGILSGVAGGCGWQHMVVLINLGTFYLVGMTVAVLLGFYFSLYAKGLWIGLICGLFLQMMSLLMLTKFSKWTRIIDQISQDNVVA